MSAALLVGYTVVVAAPAHMIARSASTHSYRVLEAIATRSSGAMPSASNPAATASTCAAVSFQVSDTQRSPSSFRNASLSPDRRTRSKNIAARFAGAFSASPARAVSAREVVGEEVDR